MPALLIIVALALAALRIGGEKGEAFQAAAHCFVGAMFYAGYVEYGYTWTTGGRSAMQKIWIGTFLTVVEVACFVWFEFFQRA